MKRFVLALVFWAPFLNASASLTVSGGITVNGAVQPLLFTWTSTLSVTGSGWAPNEAVEIILHGPLNSPGVAPRHLRALADSAELRARRGHPPEVSVETDFTLGVYLADARGNLSAAPVIPYDSGITGPSARIPRPGFYEVRAAGTVSGMVTAAGGISLCPATYSVNAPFDWGHERGGRDGVLPGGLRQFSPERFDPEWPAVWDELPVEAYGTIAPTDSNGAHQPSQISPSDNPPTHYGHDATFFLVPDSAYRWLIGTSNYYAGEAGSAELGRLELEWETLNGGGTASYGQGRIGAPLWVNPTVGDRVYVVGRWILDAGHPEVGDRTEIHPPRLLATMRKRPAIALSGATAARVDIYVSGHGGGANSMPPGLSAVLDQHGRGGGRIRDVLSPDDQKRYYQAGPLAPALVPVVTALIQQLTGQSISLPVFGEAGPSAFPWGGFGAEERAVNDMDYDFDVPLPPAPAGATSPVVDVITQPQHTTAVTELVTYTNPVNGLPATAHIHLPYRGADNGIYARTLRFSWTRGPAPPSHFVVRLNRLDVKDAAGKWQMWADVSGNWIYLSGLAPALLNTAAGQPVTLPANQADVFLAPADTLRIVVQGYRAACLDDTFGKLFGQSAYIAGLTFLAQCGPTDNQSLGGALLELPAQPAPSGTYTFGNSYFSVEVSIGAGT